MKRTKQSKPNQTRLVAMADRIIRDAMSRQRLGSRLGYTYGSGRKLYKALGYPDEKDLTFKYFYNLFDRNEIANAIIARPAKATWEGDIDIVEDGGDINESKLTTDWLSLERRLKLKSRFNSIDQLAGIGQFGLLLLGLNDISERSDWARPVASGRKLKLLYIRQIAQSDITIEQYESDSSKERFGLPLTYKISMLKNNSTGSFETDSVIVHHSRVIHINHDSLTSEYLGTPILKPVVNRVIDFEKILGGDAEMFWRGARPGYQASTKDGYELGDEALNDLEDELDKYEHDLRRFITAQGVDIQALATQIADPIGHIDAQLQAISAQTGIPKRVLIGSEKGELASSQDRNQWLSLIVARMNNFAEPSIIRPFIDRMMEFGILPKYENYSVIWPDIFAPSEDQKVEVGKKRAEALKIYAESALASEIMPTEFAIKYLLGLPEDVIDMINQAIEEMRKQEELESDEDLEFEDPEPEPEPIEDEGEEDSE